MVLPIAMGWRHLLFANWPVDPDIVETRLPDGLHVDTHDGQAWLSVVPYLNVDVRPRGVPGGVGFELPELNLRTYVTCDGEPGIYFFSLDAEGLLGVLGARLFHHLPYYAADIDMSAADGEIVFESDRRHPGAFPARFSGTYEPVGEAFVPDPDSLAAFLTERYRYYTTGRDGAIRYADIDHEPWALREVAVGIETNTLFEANGFEPPAGSPICYYSHGVDITSSRNRRWR